MDFINTGADEALVKSLGVPVAPNAAFTQAVCAAVLFNNDLHHIHLHASGHRFDRIHSMTEEYYNKAADDLDTLAELALEYNQSVPNFSLAGNFIGWTVSQRPTYGWLEAIHEVYESMALFISTMSSLRSQPELKPDAQSKLDDIMRYWNKELSYKLERRMEDNHK